MPRIKRKDYENLSDANVKKVIELLEQDKPITKKEACELLNISYNTTRLNKIIDQFRENQEYAKIRKAQNRGRPLDNSEIQDITTSYLSGESISDISKRLFRSTAIIKEAVDTIGIPTRAHNKAERQHTGLLPEACISEDFEPGEIVWSARHHRAAIIREELSVNYQAEKPGFTDVNYEQKYGSKCYAIWVLEDIDQDKEFWVQGLEVGGYNAYALAYDLGKLKHLQEKYSVDLSRI